jgi:preprotein translocase subunit SecD
MTSPFAFSAKEGSSVMLSVLVSFIFTLLVVAMVYLGTKYGMIAVILLPLLLLDAIIVCWLFAGISAIEISIVSLIAIILGMVLLFCGTINFASRVAEEYALGKTIDASLESGSKKARPAALISNAFVVVFTFIMFLFVKGEVASASIILCIFGLLNILTNVILLPWLVKSYNKTNKNQGKPYRLKQVEVITND